MSYKIPLFVQKVWQNLDFKPDGNPLRNFQNNRFLVIQGEKGNQKVIFKAVKLDNPNITTSINNEMWAIGFLATTNLKRFVPIIFKRGNNKRLIWRLEEYYKGGKAGEENQISKKFHLHIDSYIDTLIKVEEGLMKLTPKIIQKAKKDNHKFPVRYQLNNSRKYYQDKLNPYYKKEDLMSVLDFYFNNKPLLKERTSFNHGDFVLSNFILNDNKLNVIDWEWFGIDNILTDISHLWLELWPHKKIQKKIIQKFRKKIKINNFETIFRLCLLRELIFLLPKRAKSTWQKAKKVSSKHHYYSYVVFLSAGRSYESLMR